MTKPNFFVPKLMGANPTSVMTPTRHPEEVVVRFRKFSRVDLTAYQRGQYAGFLREKAEGLVSLGLAEIVEGF